MIITQTPYRMSFLEAGRIISRSFMNMAEVLFQQHSINTAL